MTCPTTAMPPLLSDWGMHSGFFLVRYRFFGKRGGFFSHQICPCFYPTEIGLAVWMPPYRQMYGRHSAKECDRTRPKKSTRRNVVGRVCLFCLRNMVGASNKGLPHCKTAPFLCSLRPQCFRTDFLNVKPHFDPDIDTAIAAWMHPLLPLHGSTRRRGTREDNHAGWETLISGKV